MHRCRERTRLWSKIYVRKEYYLYPLTLTYYLCTWSLFVLYLVVEPSKNKDFSNQNKGHLGSRYIYTRCWFHSVFFVARKLWGEHDPIWQAYLSDLWLKDQRLVTLCIVNLRLFQHVLSYLILSYLILSYLILSYRLNLVTLLWYQSLSLLKHFKHLDVLCAASKASSMWMLGTAIEGQTLETWTICLLG